MSSILLLKDNTFIHVLSLSFSKIVSIILYIGAVPWVIVDSETQGPGKVKLLFFIIKIYKRKPCFSLWSPYAWKYKRYSFNQSDMLRQADMYNIQWQWYTPSNSILKKWIRAAYMPISYFSGAFSLMIIINYLV